MNSDEVYAFAYRGHLTKAAIRQVTGASSAAKDSLSAVTHRLPLELLEERLVNRAREMAVVYTAIAAFENAVRIFVEKRLFEEIGENWWEQCVPEKRRQKAESRRDEENKIRWHAKRGMSLLEYTEIEDLKSIIVTKQEVFMPIVQSIEWAKHIRILSNILATSSCIAVI